jgi:hypothetical protein
MCGSGLKGAGVSPMSHINRAPSTTILIARPPLCPPEDYPNTDGASQ